MKKFRYIANEELQTIEEKEEIKAFWNKTLKQINLDGLIFDPHENYFTRNHILNAD